MPTPRLTLTCSTQEAGLPPGSRRPCPPLPPELLQPLPTDAARIQDFNNVMMAEYNSGSLVPCACGRTFTPEALAKHQRGCTGKR